MNVTTQVQSHKIVLKVNIELQSISFTSLCCLPCTECVHLAVITKYPFCTSRKNPLFISALKQVYFLEPGALA